MGVFKILDREGTAKRKDHGVEKYVQCSGRKLKRLGFGLRPGGQCARTLGGTVSRRRRFGSGVGSWNRIAVTNRGYCYENFVQSLIQ